MRMIGNRRIPMRQLEQLPAMAEEASN